MRRLNGLGRLAIAEPFAGGAGASLSLLFQEETPEIFINDADPAIHDLWWSILRRSAGFQALLRRTRVNMTEWRRQREVYRSSRGRSRLSRGFAAFYLNRTNRSGIIPDGGPIGGLDQSGPWKLGARFTRGALLERCARVAEYRDRIHESGLDGLDFISGLSLNSTMLLIDPPYYVKGKMLYMNGLDDDYHVALAAKLRAIQDAVWVLTYDDCPAVRRMYRGWARVRPFGLRYSAADHRSGRELMITPKWMQLPRYQTSESIAW
jgi:DNA adenine methylase